MSIFSIPESKMIERARLSNLFERLSARPQQIDIPSKVAKDISSNKSLTPPIAEELNTVLRNISALRMSCTSEARHSCNIVASTDNVGSGSPSQESCDEGWHFNEFPLAEEKKYPFTFKHMIHKLYKKEEWLRTVKEALEKSKKDYKPLAECSLRQKCIDPHGSRAKSKDVPPTRIGKGANSTVKGKQPQRKNLTAKHDVGGPLEGGDSFRALKKRCIGIRRSRSGNLRRDRDQDVFSDSHKSRKGSFVFASTISSTECLGREIYLQFPSVSPTDSCFSDAGHDASNANSPVSLMTPLSPKSRTSSYMTTGCAARMKRRISTNHQVVMLKAVPPSRFKREESQSIAVEDFLQHK